MIARNAIFFDMLRSSDPMALVMDDTSSGTIRHLSIRKNRSPGYWMYMTSRCVHGSEEFLSIKPNVVPPNTPITVRKVSKFDLRKRFHRDVGLEPPFAKVLDILFRGRAQRLSRRFLAWVMNLIDEELCAFALDRSWPCPVRTTLLLPCYCYWSFRSQITTIATKSAGLLDDRCLLISGHQGRN